MFQIVSDGGCDFNKEAAEKYNVTVVPFYIIADGDQQLREGIEIDKDDFYKRLASEKDFKPKTSQPSPHDYIEAYTPHLEDGKDLLVITLSSKVSGSNNSATMAAEMLQEKFPERRIEIFDSLNGSLGQNLMTKEIIKMRDAGLSIDETLNYGQKLVESTRLYLIVETVDYLRRGGRVGPTTALVGGILKLCPILDLQEGVWEQLDTVRGKKKALRLLEEALVYVLKGEMDNVNLSIGHVLSGDDANYFATNLKAALNISDIFVTEVGTPFGTHTGPGAILVSYCKKYEALTV